MREKTLFYYFVFQNYLREQPDNVKSFNIIGETAQFLNVVYSSINNRTIDLVIQLFNTLNEFCSVRNLSMLHQVLVLMYTWFVMFLKLLSPSEARRSTMMSN